MVKKPDREPSGPSPAPPADAGRERDGRVRDVTARGIRIRVLEAGDERAPALVLVHGLFASHRSFEDVIESLGERFHVIAPDLPGFGESEKPSPTRYAYGVEAHAESVADLIAAFGVGRASVLGHAMGGVPRAESGNATQILERRGHALRARPVSAGA